MLKHFSAILLVLTIITSGTGCLAQPSPPTPTISSDPVEVSFTLESGEKIFASLYGSGDSAVIMLHMFTYNASQKDWKRLAKLAAEEGYTVLTLDVPGFGKTPGDPAVPLWEESLLAGVDYLENKGINQIACLGACSGGTTCMYAAHDYDFIGLVLLSTEIPGEEYDYSVLTMPKFFASTEGEYDGEFADAMREMHDRSPEPREMLLLPGDAHGTDIFNTYYGTELTENIMAFLKTLH